MRPWPLLLALLVGALVASPSAAQEVPAAPGGAATETGAGASRTDPVDGAVYRYIPAGSFDDG